MADEILEEHQEGKIVRPQSKRDDDVPPGIKLPPRKTEVFDEGRLQRAAADAQQAPVVEVEEVPGEADELVPVSVAEEEYDLEPLHDGPVPPAVPGGPVAPVTPEEPKKPPRPAVTRTPETRKPQANEYTSTPTQELRKVAKECGAKGISQINSGVILLQDGYLSTAELREYCEKLELTPRLSLEEILKREGLLSEKDATSVFARRLGMEFADFEHAVVDPLASRFVDASTATRYNVLPYSVRTRDDGGVTVYIALADPENILLKDTLRAQVMEEENTDVVFAVATPSEIKENVAERYRDIYDLETAIEEMPEEEEEYVNVGTERLAAQEEPVVKLVNQIIASAAADGASDIHCETTEKQGMEVRFRVDGILKRVSPIRRSMRGEVINRFKILGDMDIAERNVPQDGRASLKLKDSTIDMRLVSSPTIYGENISVRILDKSNLQLQIQQLGFSEHNQQAFEEGFTKPHGSVLVTGPTGSGKTTTLYAALILLDSDKQNIVTIEDPVEYRVAGINHCQINEERGLTFTTALRGFMRADPDVIMVGEIRDPDTAKIAVEAAMTGHLVLSTLHTNDAASAIARLMEMDVEAYALASTMECVVAQRLCRKLCTACRQPHEPTEDELKANAYPQEIIDNREQHTFFLANPDGCQHCNHSGYRGRTAVSEVLTVSDKIKQMILERKGSEEIKQQAISDGMITLMNEGFGKVAAGITTVEEMRRVTL